MSRILSLAPAVLPILALVGGCHAPEPREITEVSAKLEPVVSGTNVFAWDAYQEARALDDGSMFCSPFSMVAALSMVYAGAEGETEAQLADALAVSGSEEDWHAQLGALVADLSGEHYRPYTLYTANKLWGQAGYPWEQDFLDLTGEQYQAPLEDADFKQDPSGARQEINDWVADNTMNRITDLFAKDDITDLTRLVLANAIYFLADWSVAFDDANTQDREFTLESGDIVEVPLMQQTEEYGYHAFEGGSLLEMPYEGDEVSMVVLLPDEHDGLPALEDQLNADQVDTWLEDAYTTEVDVRFPSFQMSYDFPITEVLEALGVEDAWIDGVADFSGMLDPTVEMLHLSTVVHKAFVRVDEQGTEAAAATGAVMDGELSAEPTEPPTFHADHPFVYFIRDKLTGTILFTGRMMDPSEAPLQGD